MTGNTKEIIVIDSMNQLGHLDRCFDVAEETVNSTESRLDIFDIASFDFDAEKYRVNNPITDTVGFIVEPKLLHGFIGMRYRVLENLGPTLKWQPTLELKDYLDICSSVIAGGWGIERDELDNDWLVKKSVGLSRAVILGGGMELLDMGPALLWTLQRYNVGERQNG